MEPEQLIDIDAVIAATTLRRSTVYAYMKDGRFPKSIGIGDRRVAWRASEVRDWIERRNSKPAVTVPANRADWASHPSTALAHFNGPWKLEVDGAAWYIEWPNGQIVASVYPPEHWDEPAYDDKQAEAMARLMTSAPEMLAALIMAWAELQSIYSHHPNVGRGQLIGQDKPTVALVFDTLKKATGL